MDVVGRITRLVYSLYGVKLKEIHEVYTYEKNIEGITEPTLLLRISKGLEDWYSGSNDDFYISIEGLVHPQSKDRIMLEMHYDIHQLSGQIDHWEVKLSGVLKEEEGQWMEILNPYPLNGEGGIWTGNYIRIEVIINQQHIII